MSNMSLQWSFARRAGANHGYVTRHPLIAIYLTAGLIGFACVALMLGA